MRKNGKYIRRRRSVINRKAFTILALVALLVGLAVGGTLAYLIDSTESVENTFTAAHVSVDVDESFDGEIKSQVNAVNNSDIPVYVRIMLISYRVNDDGNKIGGIATIPEFTPGAGWLEKNGIYYYSSPVQPGESPAADLIGDDGIKLQSYDDADGGKQVIEVIAEAIQAQPSDAVESAWPVTVGEGNVLSVG